jgi:hypothetical protein
MTTATRKKNAAKAARLPPEQGIDYAALAADAGLSAPPAADVPAAKEPGRAARKPAKAKKPGRPAGTPADAPKPLTLRYSKRVTAYAESHPALMTGLQLMALMAEHGVTIEEAARRSGLKQSQVRNLRLRGLNDAAEVEKWRKIIAGGAK